MPESDARRVLAVLDFDGTLTRRDSFLQFLEFVLGRRRLWMTLLRNGAALAAYRVHLLPNWRAKELLLCHALRDLSAEEIETCATRFAHDVLPSLVVPQAWDRVTWHRDRGDVVAVVSASLEVYLRPWAERNGIAHVAGTRLRFDGAGRLMGLDGKNCFGAEKVERLRLLIPSLHQFHVVAYGDSLGDRELLRAADRAYFRPFRGQGVGSEMPRP
jgi:HAD superfamily hydrolase (TIGR01490 family)